MGETVRPGDPLVWSVDARDPFSRGVRIRVGVREGQVVLLFPPGEGCTIEPDSADYLAASISAASSRARTQSGSRP
jgi:hypothetical protein